MFVCSAVYLMIIMLMTSMSVVFSVFVLTIHHRGARGIRPPVWLRSLTIDMLAPACCIHFSDHMIGGLLPNLMRSQQSLSWNRRRSRHSSIKFFDSEVNMIANTVRTSISIRFLSLFVCI